MILAGTAWAAAQSPSPSAPPPGMEAAAVEWICAHRGRGGGCPGRFMHEVYDPSRYVCDFCTVRWVIAQAYNVQFAAIKGDPGWLDWDEYSFQIVSSAPASREQFMQMLQTVIEQAFGFRSHIEEPPTKVYRLVIAKHGPTFKPAATPQVETKAALMGGIRYYDSITQLVGSLNSDYYSGLFNVDHPVVDGTGLQGKFDIELRLGTDPTNTSLIALVKEQLGLDPILTEGHARYLVVDAVQHRVARWTAP